MAFNYSKLEGKIKEVLGSQREYAKKMNWSERTVCLKLANKIAFTQKDIVKTVAILHLTANDIPDYFFCPESSIC